MTKNAVRSFSLITVLLLSLFGCQWFVASPRLEHLDITGADALFVSSTASARGVLGGGDGDTVPMKIMSDGSVAVVEESATRGGLLNFDSYQIIEFKNLNARWVIVGYGYPPSQVEQSYLVEKTTGNVFFLSEIVTHTAGGLPGPNYEAASWVYGFPDFAIVHGRPWDSGGPASFNDRAIFRIDLSTPSRVTGAVLVEDLTDEHGYGMNAIYATASGVVFYRTAFGHGNVLFGRSPTGSVQLLMQDNHDEMFLLDDALVYIDWDNALVDVWYDGSQFITGTSSYPEVPSGTVRRQNLGTRTFMVHDQYVVEVTDFRNGGAVQRLSLVSDASPYTAAWSSNEMAIATTSGSQAEIRIYNVDTGESTVVFGNSEMYVDSLAVSGGKLYVGGIASSNGVRAIGMYDGVEFTITAEVDTLAPIVITPID